MQKRGSMINPIATGDTGFDILSQKNHFLCQTSFTLLAGKSLSYPIPASPYSGEGLQKIKLVFFI